ncbi:FUSC family protein [Sanguibacter suarezii]|uniref:FUSC family protein n=1 Tax=Sanguibacter suarezii TaxID=60921 RepID=UPI000A96B848|nr:FUSC family protein [Sanguibacter suarezii]
MGDTTKVGDLRENPADDGSFVMSQLARAMVQLRVRVRQGSTRVRVGFWPIILVSVAASLSYGLSLWFLGHTYPFFAPVCVWICLGFSTDRSMRRVAELGIGVTVGVGLGELIVHRIGVGVLQIGLVLALSALVARFIDRGALLTTQAGVQAIVIVGLPMAATGGGFGRWTDALVGAAVAFLVAAFTPSDLRRRPRRIGGEGLIELARTFEAVAHGVRSGDPSDREAALLRGRASEPALDEWQAVTREALENSRVTASGRKYREELVSIGRSSVLVDRTMRTVRVIARRALSLPTGPVVDQLAGLLDDLAEATRDLAEAVASGRDPRRARARIAAVAAAADPGALGSGDWQVQSLILILRSAIVDLQEAAGATPEQAREALAPM